MALELIEIKDFPRTTSVTGSGEELIVVSKADGKTYGIKTSDFKAFLGTVTSIAPRPLSPTDPEPTLDGVYIPTVDGTYANAGGLVRDTTEGGVDEGMGVEFIKNGAVWVKNSYPLPQAENKIENWTDGRYDLGTQKIHKGQIWTVTNPSTGQEPGTVEGIGRHWREELDKVASSDLSIISRASDNFSSIYNINNVQTGYYRPINNKLVKDSSVNWISYPQISVKEGDKVRVTNYSLSSDVQVLAFMTDLDAIVISTVHRNTEKDTTITIGEGVELLYLNLAAAVGIGNDPTGNTLGITIHKSDSVRLINEIKGIGLKASELADNITFNGDVINPKSIATKEYVDTFSVSSGSYIMEGFPSDSLGVNGDGYIDVNTGRMYVKSGDSWGEGKYPYGKDVDFAYPLDFTWRPLSFKKQANAKYIPNIQDIESFAKEDMTSLVPHYVGTSGVVGNNGLTRDKPFRTIQVALDAGARNIILLSGIYDRYQQMPDYYDTTAQPLIIRAEKDGSVFFAGGDKGSSFTWTKDVNVYTTTRTLVDNVMDYNATGIYGLPVSYVRKNTVAEVKATAGSWCFIGSSVTVNTLDGEEPNDKHYVVLLATTPRYTAMGNAPYVYMRGINFHTCGVASSLRIESDTTIQQFSTKAYVKNCWFAFNRSGNGLSYDNLTEVWTQGCKGAFNKRDSFSYHTSKISSGYLPMNVVEMNCWSRSTGIDFSSEVSSNGSTAHEGATIIRVGGDFADARGSVVIDVNDGIRSLNLNISSFDSILTGQASFLVNGEDSKSWLYACEGGGSSFSATANGGATMYHDEDTELIGDTSGNVVSI